MIRRIERIMSLEDTQQLTALAIELATSCSDGPGSGSKALRIAHGPFKRSLVDVQPPFFGNAVTPKPGQPRSLAAHPLRGSGRFG